MSIGLDLGSTQFRSIRQQGSRLIGRSCYTEILSLPDTPGHRRLLDRDRVKYAECAGTLVVLDLPAREWGELLSHPVRSLLLDGQMPHYDMLARQVLSLMVDAVLPEARTPGEICSLTIPGELLPTDDSPERNFFFRLVSLRGYTPIAVGQGHAIVLAELGSSGFSGLGISLGASVTEFSLNHSGRELARCSIPWGTSSLTSDLSLDLSRGENLPEKTKAQITDFLVELMMEAGNRIDQNEGFRVLSQPVSIVVSGGITGLPEMPSMLESAWNRAAWPINRRSLHIASQPDFAIARGCLINAILESEAELIGIAA